MAAIQLSRSLNPAVPGTQTCSVVQARGSAHPIHPAVYPSIHPSIHPSARSIDQSVPINHSFFSITLTHSIHPSIHCCLHHVTNIVSSRQLAAINRSVNPSIDCNKIRVNQSVRSIGQSINPQHFDQSINQIDVLAGASEERLWALSALPLCLARAGMWPPLW